jgi:hypothetical protein
MTAFEPDAQPPQPEAERSPPPPTDEPRRVSWRPVVALMCFAAALLTLAGAFLTLFTGDIRFDDSRVIITITSWDVQAQADGVPEPNVPAAPANGAPLMLAAVILLAAAVLALFATAAPGSPRIGRASWISAVTGAAFLTGAVLTVGVQELTWLDTYRFADVPEWPRLPPGSSRTPPYWASRAWPPRIRARRW